MLRVWGTVILCTSQRVYIHLASRINAQVILVTVKKLPLSLWQICACTLFIGETTLLGDFNDHVSVDKQSVHNAFC